jgi:hypothetical protein
MNDGVSVLRQLLGAEHGGEAQGVVLVVLRKVDTEVSLCWRLLGLELLSAILDCWRLNEPTLSSLKKTPSAKISSGEGINDWCFRPRRVTGVDAIAAVMVGGFALAV